MKDWAMTLAMVIWLVLISACIMWLACYTDWFPIR
jgi:hypothetical protein